jgi:hypothetical protein
MLARSMAYLLLCQTANLGAEALAGGSDLSEDDLEGRHDLAPVVRFQFAASDNNKTLLHHRLQPSIPAHVSIHR